jgi:hypothetical protein
MQSDKRDKFYILPLIWFCRMILPSAIFIPSTTKTFLQGDLVRIILIALLSLGLNSAAMAESAEGKKPWQVELEQYQSGLASRTQISLVLGLARHAPVMVASCGASLAVSAATLVTDTLPITNVVSESIANMSNGQYQTQDFDSVLSLEALGELARGTTGGAIAGAAELVEFMFIYLAGEEKERGFEMVKKLYASTFATIDALFAEKSKCMMSMSKVFMLTGELKARNAGANSTSYPLDGPTVP